MEISHHNGVSVIMAVWNVKLIYIFVDGNHQCNISTPKSIPGSIFPVTCLSSRNCLDNLILCQIITINPLQPYLVWSDVHKTMGICMQYINQLWTHKGHPMYCPYGWAMGCLLWGPCSDVIHQSEFDLTEVTPCIAFAYGTWGICCEDPLVMKYINQIFNSQRTPHVSPWLTSHGVSVVWFWHS